VVTLGREARVDYIPGTRFENWDTDEPSERGIDGIARLDQTLSETVATYRGVRPVEQGEGGSSECWARQKAAEACAA
jgi:hypothetical protein